MTMVIPYLRSAVIRSAEGQPLVQGLPVPVPEAGKSGGVSVRLTSSLLGAGESVSHLDAGAGGNRGNRAVATQRPAHEDSTWTQDGCSDAQWICRLVENGLVRPSFVPPVEIRRLRHLTRLNTDFQESIEVVLDGLESWSARRCCTEAVAFTSATVTSVVCTSVIRLGAGPLSLTASEEARRVSVRRTL